MSERTMSVKRAMARMDLSELAEITKYGHERQGILRRRESDAKDQAHYQKIANLPVGSRVVVNAHGYRDFPRGTVLTIDGFDTNARKYRLRVRTEAGKIWRFSNSAVVDYDLIPAAEYNAESGPNKMIMFMKGVGR